MVKERIDHRQLLALLIISRITISLLSKPLLADPAVTRDAWLVDLIAALPSAVLALGPTLWLLSRGPGLALPDLLERVLGRWLAGLFLCLQGLLITLTFAVDLRGVGDFLGGAFLPRFPITIPTLLVLALSLWAALAGLEVLGRFALVSTALLVLASAGILLLVLPEIEWQAFLPFNFLVQGPLPTLRHVLITAGRWHEVLWLSLALPALPGRLWSRVTLASVAVGLLWTILDVSTTGTLGPLQTLVIYPYLTLTRVVRVTGMLERVDALMLIVWMLCCCVRFGLLLWSLARLVGAIIRVRERLVTPPLASIIFFLSLLLSPSVQRLQYFARPAVMVPLTLLIFYLPPLVALPVSYLRPKPLCGGSHGIGSPR